MKEHIKDLAGIVLFSLFIVAAFFWPIILILPACLILYSAIFVWKYDTPGMRDLGRCATGRKPKP